MSSIKTVQELVRLLDACSSFNAPIAGICVDSRDIKPGDVFCALKGARTDGHLFLEEAYAKGAACALVDSSYKGKSILPLIKVDDVLAGLKGASKKILDALKAKIVAITGSVGKTSTKELVATLLEGKYRVGKTLGNGNSQIGLPLNILNNISGDEEILVLEMGMTHPGEIAKLVQMAPPHIALITEIACVHIVNFQSLSDIAREKGEIFSHPRTEAGFLPLEIPFYEDLSKIGRFPKNTFSLLKNNADYFLENRSGNLYFYEKEKLLGKIDFPIAGDHHKRNFLSALSIARYFGMSLEEISDRIPFLKLPEKRFQLMEKSGILFVNDSYNASPIAVKAALKNLPKPKRAGGSKIAVLGGMAELGHLSDSCHAEVGEAALECVDLLLCLGAECAPAVDVWKREKREGHLFDNLSSLREFLYNRVSPGDVVLVKGSKSKEMWKVLDAFK